MDYKWVDFESMTREWIGVDCVSLLNGDIEEKWIGMYVLETSCMI